MWNVILNLSSTLNHILILNCNICSYAMEKTSDGHIPIWYLCGKELQRHRCVVSVSTGNVTTLKFRIFQLLKAFQVSSAKNDEYLTKQICNRKKRICDTG